MDIYSRGYCEENTWAIVYAETRTARAGSTRTLVRMRAICAICAAMAFVSVLTIMIGSTRHVSGHMMSMDQPDDVTASSWVYTIKANEDTHYFTNLPEFFADYSWSESLRLYRGSTHESVALIRFPTIKGVTADEIRTSALALDMVDCKGSTLPRVFVFAAFGVIDDWNYKGLERGENPRLATNGSPAEFWLDDGTQTIVFMGIEPVVREWYLDDAANHGIAIKLGNLHREGLCFARSIESGFPARLQMEITHPVTTTLSVPWVSR